MSTSSEKPACHLRGGTDCSCLNLSGQFVRQRKTRLLHVGGVATGNCLHTWLAIPSRACSCPAERDDMEHLDAAAGVAFLGCLLGASHLQGVGMHSTLTR